MRLELNQPATRENPLRAFSTVLWAFLGIRKRNASKRDLSSLKPWQVLTVGIILAAVFVSVLVTLVWLIAG